MIKVQPRARGAHDFISVDPAYCLPERDRQRLQAVGSLQSMFDELEEDGVFVKPELTYSTLRDQRRICEPIIPSAKDVWGSSSCDSIWSSGAVCEASSYYHVECGAHIAHY